MGECGVGVLEGRGGGEVRIVEVMAGAKTSFVVAM